MSTRGKDCVKGQLAHPVTGVGQSRNQHGDAREGKLPLSRRLGCPILYFHMICCLSSVTTAFSAQTLRYLRHFPKEYYS